MVTSTFRFAATTTLGCLLFTATSAAAQDWSNWRGPNWDGSSTAKNLPVDFAKDKHVRWATAMPGAGASTPIVIGERIFLTSVDTARERLVAICLDRRSGDVVWQKDAGSGYGGGSRIAKGRRSTYASPSPVTDGERVVFFFGNGDLVGFDFAGEEIWRRNIQKEYGDFAFNWTFASSPLMWEGRLYLPVMQRDVPIQRRGGGRGRSGGRGERGGRAGGQPGGGNRSGGGGGGGRGPNAGQLPVTNLADPIESFLLAMDPKTGETLFKHVRPSQAQVESLEAYSTITPFVGKDGRKELLVVGGDVITGHDPATGKELWRWGTWNEGHRERFWRLVPSVVVGDGVALACAPKRAPVYAVKLGGNGELGADALAWQSAGRPNPVSTDVPTPAFHDGHFYVLSDVQSALSKVKASDGEVVWTTKLERRPLWRASPTIADGKVFFMNHGGHVMVVDCKSGDIVHQAEMGEEDDDLTRSSIVAAHDSLFIRTNAKLFCIGK